MNFKDFIWVNLVKILNNFTKIKAYCSKIKLNKIKGLTCLQLQN